MRMHSRCALVVVMAARVFLLLLTCGLHCPSPRTTICTHTRFATRTLSHPLRFNGSRTTHHGRLTRRRTLHGGR